MNILGVDTGGTFTDFVLLDNNGLRIHKLLSTPEAPERAILQGMAALGLNNSKQLKQTTVIHGSTVATNAVLEGKGVKTVYITNRGFADLLSLGRQARLELYNLQPQTEPEPVPPELCLETGGRLSARGEVLEPLSDADLEALQQQIAELAPQAVAINLLFSYIDARFEERIAAALPEGLFVSRSSAILPEYREYERGISTWLNAWVGPLVAGYLQRLQEGVGEAALSVMQSTGRTIRADLAAGQAVNMLLSGPAGGLAAARYIGQLTGHPQLLSFDMGGTSTDVALVEEQLRLTTEGKIAGYPVAVPMVDMHTIGAGGGSIAYVDAGGVLRVGPESAGAQPGPACYGNGGERATVTDANLVLGRLPAGQLLGGNMPLDLEAARRVLGVLAQQMGMSVEAAAAGIVRVVDEQMARALRVMSVQRGLDPAALALFSFGGAGGLHVCALAEALQMQHALVPIHGGVLSALGMLVAPRGRELSRTLGGVVQEINVDELDAGFVQLEQQAIEQLLQEGVGSGEVSLQRRVDLRYLGQSHSLNCPWHETLDQTLEVFQQQHQALYGHRLDEAVELVNIRISAAGPQPQLALEAESVAGGTEVENVPVHGVLGEVPCLRRGQLDPDKVYQGPLLITEVVSTTWVSEGWNCRVHPSGCLLLQREVQGDK